jgi:GT2 family glycosyltransferase
MIRAYSDQALWKTLADGGREHIAVQFGLQRLEEAVRRFLETAKRVEPKSYDPAFQFSYLKVEDHTPSALTFRPAHHRQLLRTLGYWQLGQMELQAGRPAEALQQFRHIFTTQRGEIPATVLHRRLISDMRDCYGQLEKHDEVERCEEEIERLRKAVAAPKYKLEVIRGGKHRGPEGALDLSVIIPTFNRRATLQLCLAALAMQTLPAERFEVIVIDDGSTDGTEGCCRANAYPFSSLQYLRQENQGAGAARNAGVAAARGEYLLFLNDDSIAAPNLLAEHISFHRRNGQQRWAVLGAFVASAECNRRAVSLWINRSTFLFPQNALRPGQSCDAAYFITCNLSIKRRAVLDAGSFDTSLRVAEDTELGTRLAARGYRVKYHPLAAAWHEHASFTTADLLKRAAVYGPVHVELFRKHPKLLGEGTSPFGKLQPADYRRMETYVAEKQTVVEAALCALEALDNIDLIELQRRGELNDAQLRELLGQVAKLVPLVYWHALFASFLKASASAENQPTANLQLAGVPGP